MARKKETKKIVEEVKEEVKSERVVFDEQAQEAKRLAEEAILIKQRNPRA